MRAMDSRPLIGLVTNDLVGSYQYAFWSGMKAAAVEEDCDLVSINGGELGSTDHTKAMRNCAFDLIPEFGLDALVVLSPPLSNAADPGRTDAFFDSIGSIPYLTVGFSRPGHPSLLVDNAAGMRAAVEHLILAHGRSRFAFVGGPNFNPDAMERRESFLATLERSGIPFDSRLEATGGWDYGVARERVLALVDSGIPFDALVAANDDMALAAMDALRERGRRVPSDVVVVGFDDIEEGQWSSPSLSTVHQPVFEQGFKSIGLCLEHLEGSAPGAPQRLRSAFLERGSCGCGTRSMSDVRKDLAQDLLPARGAPGGPEHREAVSSQCMEILGETRFSPDLEDLASAVALGCELRDDEAATTKLLHLMDLASRNSDKPDRWQVFLTRLRRASLPFFLSDPQMATRLESLIHGLRIAVHERSVQFLSRGFAQLQRWSREVYQTSLRLADADDRGAFSDALESSARILRISSLQLLVRKQGGKGWVVPLSVDKGVRSEARIHGDDLAAILRQIRDGSPFRTAKVVEPLVFGNSHLGHMIVEPGVRLGMLLDSLRGQIANTLHQMHHHHHGRSHAGEPGTK